MLATHPQRGGAEMGGLPRHDLPPSLLSGKREVDGSEQKGGTLFVPLVGDWTLSRANDGMRQG